MEKRKKKNTFQKDIIRIEQGRIVNYKIDYHDIVITDAKYSTTFSDDKIGKILDSSSWQAKLICILISLILPITSTFLLLGSKIIAITFYVISIFPALFMFISFRKLNKLKKNAAYVFENCRVPVYGNIVSIKEKKYYPGKNRGFIIVFILTYSFQDSSGILQTRTVQKPIYHQNTINYLTNNQPFKIIYDTQKEIYLILKD